MPAQRDFGRIRIGADAARRGLRSDPCGHHHAGCEAVGADAAGPELEGLVALRQVGLDPEAAAAVPLDLRSCLRVSR